MIELKGTEKQIAWANDIRRDIVSFFENIKKDEEERFKGIEGGSSIILKAVKLIDSATTFIELYDHKAYMNLACLQILDSYFYSIKKEKIYECEDKKELKARRRALSDACATEVYSKNWWFKEY